jgi:hypothetical protein
MVRRNESETKKRSGRSKILKDKIIAEARKV